MTNTTNTKEHTGQKEKRKEIPFLEELNIRDYFAAKAMQAMLGSPNCPMELCENELATQAYMTADAMLKAREQ